MAVRSAAGQLAGELRETIEGEVRFDAGSRALYATDLSIYRQVPIGVVVPRTVEDVVATVAVCRRHGAPILARGCGSSLVGQTTNVAVVIDFSKFLNRIVELDPDRRLARVEPGVICDQLRDAAEEHRLTFGPDPATHRYCTLGGMIGNNSCGVHSVMAGRTADNIEELDVLTHDGVRLRVGRTDDAELERLASAGGRPGEIYRGLRDLRDRYGGLVREKYPDIPRRVSGYNLDELLPERGFNVARALVGTESTCALVLEATVRLVPSPRHRTLAVVAYHDQFAAADDVLAILEHGPIGLEAVDETVTRNMLEADLLADDVALYPPGGAWLLAEFGADSESEAIDRARGLEAALMKRNGGASTVEVVSDGEGQRRIWAVREAAIGASRIPGKLETWPSFEDAAVPPERLGGYLRDFTKLLGRHGLSCVFFGHYGQGCVHARIGFDLKSEPGVRTFLRFLDEATDLVLSYGGSLSGEHGDGQAHAHHLVKMFGPDLMEAMRAFKRLWDPDWKMNPGKVIDAYAPDENLRDGPDYHPPALNTYFSFREDGSSFARAAARCFGVGKCRSLAGAMCPSFQATREEMHTTRGRAHLLFELLKGDPLDGGWHDAHVKEALDLCLACKACKAECPVNVDMATYKAEFLAHYYEDRRRPAAAYTFGRLDRWAHLAERAPDLTNLFARLPGARKTLGIAPERTLPRFARETFRAWFERRGPRGDGAPVLLWPDTFNDHFRPRTASAAVEVLEAAGFRVQLPRARVCCGRPLYDYGMLSLARRYLERTLAVLRDELRTEMPVVVLEPSCAAVFRDELPNLLPDDEDARRLAAQTHLLAGFLREHAPEFAPSELGGRAVLHGHCHQNALFGLDADQELLGRLVELDSPETGCCGMAGSFGYARENYAVSVACAERVLLPAVRAAPEALVVTDGFSCREQIEQLAGRPTMHLAEVLRAALSGTP